MRNIPYEKGYDGQSRTIAFDCHSHLEWEKNAGIGGKKEQTSHFKKVILPTSWRMDTRMGASTVWGKRQNSATDRSDALRELKRH